MLKRFQPGVKPHSTARGGVLWLAMPVAGVRVAKMRRWLIWMSCLMLQAAAWAQVEVSLVVEQTQFLPREALRVGVRITNRSGQTLRLGQSDEWVHFLVQTQTGAPVPATGPMDVVRPFEIESSKVATRFIDLAPAYALTQPGRFQISAEVFIKEWDQKLESKPVDIEIVKGFKIWEQNFGLPKSTAGDALPPEVRKYSLLKLQALDKIRLYACVSDRNEMIVYRAFPVGAMVSFSKPEVQLDKDSNLHVLNQSGSKWFFYAVVTPFGELKLRQTYHYGSIRPTLKPDGEGGIHVSGGLRQITKDDYPPVEEKVVEVEDKPLAPAPPSAPPADAQQVKSGKKEKKKN